MAEEQLNEAPEGAAPEELTQDTVIPDGGQPSPEEILKFDPFGPPKEAPKPAGQEGKEKADGKAAPKADAAAPKPPVGVPAKTPEQLIAEHTASIRQMLERAPQPATPVPAAKTEPTTAAPPKFNLGIPEQMLTMLNSEDMRDRSVATHALINGVANAIWKEFETAYEQRIQQEVNTLVQNFPRVIEAHMNSRNEQQRIHNDFYGTYKMFSEPQWIPLIQAHAAQLMNEMAAQGHQVTGWTPQMRDAIAERLFAQFPMLREGQKPNGQAQPTGRRQFATGGGGNRPPAEAGPASEMLSVLGIKPN